MIKATITRLFIGGALAIITGAIVAVIAIGIAMANDIFVMNGPDVVAVRGSALAISLLGLAVVGAVAIMAGLIAGLVAWIGALLRAIDPRRYRRRSAPARSDSSCCCSRLPAAAPTAIRD